MVAVCPVSSLTEKEKSYNYRLLSSEQHTRANYLSSQRPCSSTGYQLQVIFRAGCTYYMYYLISNLAEQDISSKLSAPLIGVG